MKKQRRSIAILGLAPAGFCCALCHEGGNDMVQIAMTHGRIGIWHLQCAQEYFRVPVMESIVPVMESMKPKVAAALERK